MNVTRLIWACQNPVDGLSLPIDSGLEGDRCRAIVPPWRPNRAKTAAVGLQSSPPPPGPLPLSDAPANPWGNFARWSGRKKGAETSALRKYKRSEPPVQTYRSFRQRRKGASYSSWNSSSFSLKPQLIGSAMSLLHSLAVTPRNSSPTGFGVAFAEDTAANARKILHD